MALPALATAYKSYLAETDQLTDEPTVMICNQALGEIETMRRERHEWGSEIPKPRTPDSNALKALRQAVAAANDDVVDQSEQVA